MRIIFAFKEYKHVYCVVFCSQVCLFVCLVNGIERVHGCRFSFAVSPLSTVQSDKYLVVGLRYLRHFVSCVETESSWHVHKSR
jgi:hypothetical protein